MATKKTTTKKTTSKKKASTTKAAAGNRKAAKGKTPEKAAAKKPAKKKAAKKAPTRKRAKTLSLEERYRITEEEAYYIAERSGFLRDRVECWAEAEAVVAKTYGA